MTQQRFQLARELFLQARQLKDGEREAFLQRACGQDVDLRREVMSLLEANVTSDAFLEQPALGTDFNVSAQPRRPYLPEIIGYAVIAQISQGGQAVVYKAIQQKTSKTVAIKLLKEGLLADENAQQRFQREVRVLAALNHPNIVQIIDSGDTTDGREFLVMNYIDGCALDDFIRQRTNASGAAPDAAAMLQLFLKICDAVNAAHLRGITHRDLSPSNILIDERNEPHILDFGLARTAFDRLLNLGRKDISVTGQFLGKLAYASPEQARGDRDKIDIRTDVYALGVILYQIVTGGHFPYEVVGNIADVLNNIIHSKPKPPSEVLTAGATTTAPRRIRKRHPSVVNETIEAIVLKALEKKPEDRYQSAGEFARDIGNYLSGLPTFAQTPHARREPRLRFTIRPQSIRRTILLGLAAGSVTAAACGIAYYIRFHMILNEIQQRTHLGS
jgi:serine/threonine protein kinase